MSELYLASNWMVDIRQLKNLQELEKLITQYGGQFSILPDIYFREDKPFVDKLLVRIANDHSDQFTQQTNELGFAGWEEVQPELFENELVFNPFHMSNYSQRTWEARLMVAHQHNFPSRSKPQLEDDIRWDDGGIGVRVFNSLKCTGIVTVGDVLDMLKRGPDAMLAIRNFNVNSLDELIEILREKGYLKDE